MSSRWIWSVVAVGVMGVALAAEKAEVTSADAIAAALSKPAAPTEVVKTRGLKIKAREEESREANAGQGAIDLQIPFAVNSASLMPDAQSQLRELARALASTQLAGQSFVLAGHTDASGKASLNRELSLARATAVRDYLANAGVDAKGLSVAGYGSDRPLPGKNPNDAQNRRVEVRLLEVAP